MWQPPSPIKSLQTGVYQPPQLIKPLQKNVYQPPRLFGVRSRIASMQQFESPLSHNINMINNLREELDVAKLDIEAVESEKYILRSSLRESLRKDQPRGQAIRFGITDKLGNQVPIEGGFSLSNWELWKEIRKHVPGLGHLKQRSPLAEKTTALRNAMGNKIIQNKRDPAKATFKTGDEFNINVSATGYMEAERDMYNFIEYGIQPRVPPPGPAVAPPGPAVAPPGELRTTEA